ncbi:hypothetical protein PV762_24130 [Mitsuaria sp. CC2]|uniref:hypothetical protein n=1 Tax=Mitsuaria sp. CC2 TaxID=3029186 RepID=UPI003B8BD4AF
MEARLASADDQSTETGEKLSKQRNVQQQNGSVEASILAEAVYWRETRWPQALLAAAEARGIDCKRAIVVDLDIDYPGMPRLFGLILTADKEFIRFEIETDSSHDHIEAIEAWDNVTEQQNLSQHNRGTGWGKGALALKVLNQLNAPC